MHTGRSTTPAKRGLRLPKESGMHHAIFDDDGADPDLSLSSLESSLNSLFGGKDIFHGEPASDHSSDAESIKREKCDLHCKHHAKMTMLIKYQQSFLKDDPPSKYSGELKAGTLKRMGMRDS